MEAKIKATLERIDRYEEKVAADVTNSATDIIEKAAEELLSIIKIPVAIQTTNIPSKDMTGLDPYYTKLCATISCHLYKHDCSKDNFDLDDTTQEGDCNNLKKDVVGLTKKEETAAPEIILYDSNGFLKCCNPPFVVVVAGTTMILGWRGSSTIMDWDRDFGFYTSSSFRWKHVAKMVKVQGAYMSLVENCMINHEDTILKTIHDKNITEIVCTGHSLGGGVAQVAHLWLEGSLHQAQAQAQDQTQSNNPWSEFAGGKLSVRTLSFEGPMTTLFKSNDDTTTSKEDYEKGVQFLTKCGANMCTTCYGMDVVPRLYGNLDFLLDLINNVIDNTEQGTFRVLRPVEKAVFDMLKGVLGLGTNKANNNGILQPYIDVAERYQHIGKILYYEDADSEPKLYVDNRNGISLHDDDHDGGVPLSLPQFKDIKYKAVVGRDNNILEDTLYDHTFIVFGPGLTLKFECWMEAFLSIYVYFFGPK